MSEEREKRRQRHSGLLKAKRVLYQQGVGEGDTYKRDRLEGEGERKEKRDQYREKKRKKKH